MLSLELRQQPRIKYNTNTQYKSNHTIIQTAVPNQSHGVEIFRKPHS